MLVTPEFLARQKKIFRPEDVDRCHAKMLAWLEGPKGRGKAASQTRFLHFLRDAEPLGVEKKEKVEAEVPGWRELLLEADPELNLPNEWGELPEKMRNWARVRRAKMETVK